MAFQGMWSVGQCPSGGKDGSATKKNLVSRLLIHVQFSLSTHFYVITDIWTVTDRAHFENCCVNDSLWFDKSCRDTGSCVASIVLLREDTAPETICLAVCSGFRWAALDAGMYCVRQGPSETTCCCCEKTHDAKSPVSLRLEILYHPCGAYIIVSVSLDFLVNAAETMFCINLPVNTVFH